MTTVHGLTYRLLIYTQMHVHYCRRFITILIWKFIHIFGHIGNCNIHIHTQKYTFNTLIDLLQYSFGIHSFTWTDSKLCFIIR